MPDQEAMVIMWVLASEVAFWANDGGTYGGGVALFLACSASSFFPECNVGFVKYTIHVPFSLNEGGVRCYATVSITVVSAVSS